MSRMSEMSIEIQEMYQKDRMGAPEIADILNIPLSQVEAVISQYLSDAKDSDDGQPTEYEEWQDYMGGDDWDHGQYDGDC